MKEYLEVLEKRGEHYNYDWCTRTRFDTRPFVASLIKPGMNILDYGCGARGTLLREDLGLSKGGFCKKPNINVDGLDIADNPLAIYKSRDDVCKKYDMIICCDVIEHMDASELPVLFEWFSKIAPIVVISTCFIYDISSFLYFYWDITHIRPYQTRDVKLLMEHYGYADSKAYLTQPAIAPHRIIQAYLNYAPPYNGIVFVGRKHDKEQEP